MSQESLVYCPKCEAANTADAELCSMCGHRLAATAPSGSTEQLPTKAALLIEQLVRERVERTRKRRLVLAAVVSILVTSSVLGWIGVEWFDISRTDRIVVWVLFTVLVAALLGAFILYIISARVSQDSPLGQMLRRPGQTGTCEACGHTVSPKAEKCTNCGHPTPQAVRRATLPTAVAFLLCVVLCGGGWFWLSDTWEEAGRQVERQQADDRATGRGDSGMARVMIQEFVKKRLLSPGSAKFPGMFERPKVEELGNNRYRLRSWVDSQNAFGALLRSHYTAVVRDEGNDRWTLESLTMD